MRRLVAWVSGLAGGFAAYRWLRRRRLRAHGGGDDVFVEGPDPRAEALRAKLDQSAEAEPEPPEDEPDAADPDARRRRVRERAQASIDEMRRREPSEP